MDAVLIGINGEVYVILNGKIFKSYTCYSIGDICSECYFDNKGCSDEYTICTELNSYILYNKQCRFYTHGVSKRKVIGDMENFQLAEISLFMNSIFKRLLYEGC